MGWTAKAALWVCGLGQIGLALHFHAFSKDYISVNGGAGAECLKEESIGSGTMSWPCTTSPARSLAWRC